ncbi:hypothetical protein O181_001559 [Austropuccinia psidii MF-1]|uniref:Uncharacterized protein n=1 Tax=Austropuccinia psidii MF-1 TaxID=1389203 RepID=A0A9Q3GBZ6_9BASI|nr:hypothetical protein [Austropuccinia psidii MF-1]
MATRAGRVYESSTASLLVPIMHFTSGIVFMQFGNTLSKHGFKKSRFSFISTIIAISLHVIQVGLEFWIRYNASKAYLRNSGYSYYLYEGLTTWLTGFTSLIVQCHFARIAYKLSEKKVKIKFLFIALICLATCITACGTGIFYIQGYATGVFLSSTPFEVMHRMLNGFYISWLVMSSISDISIAMVVSRALYKKRISVRNKGLINFLRRLFSLSIKTFSLTSITALASFTITILPTLLPTFLNEEDHFQATSFFINSILPRIYLFSYFFSLEPPSLEATCDSDACVASLKSNQSTNSISEGAREIIQNVESFHKISRNRVRTSIDNKDFTMKEQNT